MKYKNYSNTAAQTYLEFIAIEPDKSFLPPILLNQFFQTKYIETSPTYYWGHIKFIFWSCSLFSSMYNQSSLHLKFFSYYLPNPIFWSFSCPYPSHIQCKYSLVTGLSQFTLLELFQLSLCFSINFLLKSSLHFLNTHYPPFFYVEGKQPRATKIKQKSPL